MHLKNFVNCTLQTYTDFINYLTFKKVIINKILKKELIFGNNIILFML